MEITTKVRLKPLFLQEQHINHFGLKLLSTVCELVHNGDKCDDSNWALNLTDALYGIYPEKLAKKAKIN